VETPALSHRLARRQRTWPSLNCTRACEAAGFEDESFDLVSSYHLVHQLPRGINREALAEAFRNLEPGGDIVMTDVPCYFKLDKLAARRFDDVARLGGQLYRRAACTIDWVAEAEEVGFTQVRGYTSGRGTRMFWSRPSPPAERA
jgi:SAM-dependent methyltransferase